MTESVFEDVDLPEDDTEPDEHGNTPRECEVCALDPPEDGPVITTNRSLFGAGHKLWISPVCTAHDDIDVENKVQSLLEYSGLDFLAGGIATGVLTLEEAKEHLPESDHDELDAELSRIND